MVLLVLNQSCTSASGTPIHLARSFFASQLVVSLLENVFQLLQLSLDEYGAMLEWQPVSQASTALAEAVVDHCRYA